MIFPIRFFICNIFISIFLSFLFLLKKLLKRHMTITVRHHFWYIFLITLLLPFLPYQNVLSGQWLWYVQRWLSQDSSHFPLTITKNITNATKSPVLKWQDLSTAIASSNTMGNRILWGIWITGMSAASLYFIYNMIRIYILQKQAYPITKETEPELCHQFSSCLQELRLKRNIRLYASCHLSSPVSYGCIHPAVIIPQDLDIVLSEGEVRFIFLHELQHHKQKDSIINMFACLLQIPYWFNFFIWHGFHQLKKDCEIACDHSVIDVIGKENSKKYGHMIIKYAEQMQNGIFLSPLSTIGGSKAVIRQRIMEIANYKKDSVFQKIKSRSILFLSILLLVGFRPFFNIYAAQPSSFHLQKENWKSIDVSSYFGSMEGSFILYDINRDQFQIYNKKMSEQRISPDSTFKIYSGLFALEENKISPDSSFQKWNGTKQPFDAWNQDQTLDTAMRDSVNWYFQNLDRQLGLPTLYAYYNRISYGNCDLSGGINDYWAESSLKISPMEQVILLSNLLQNKWGFEKQNIAAIKRSLFLSDTSIGKLYGKTGTGITTRQNGNGWFVGFLENNKHIYCFATNLRNSKNASGSTAAEITMNILHHIL